MTFFKWIDAFSYNENKKSISRIVLIKILSYAKFILSLLAKNTEEFMVEKQTRVYGQKIDLDSKKIKVFFDQRAIDFMHNKRTRNTTVLLGDGNTVYADRWNLFEKKHILPVLNVKKNDSVLDIGCGVGRWAEHLLPLCGQYIGTDISEEMIAAATKLFGSKYKYAKFINTSFQNIFNNSEIKEKQFNIIIIAGVSMYLNDTELQKCYEKLCDYLAPSGMLYLEESVGIKERLTLNNIWSENLNSHYWAVYRTVEEYLYLLKPLINSTTIIKCGYLHNLDKKELQETGHWHIMLRKNTE